MLWLRGACCDVDGRNLYLGESNGNDIAYFASAFGNRCLSCTRWSPNVDFDQIQSKVSSDMLGHVRNDQKRNCVAGMWSPRIRRGRDVVGMWSERGRTWSERGRNVVGTWSPVVGTYVLICRIDECGFDAIHVANLYLDAQIFKNQGFLFDLVANVPGSIGTRALWRDSAE